MIEGETTELASKLVCEAFSKWFSWLSFPVVFFLSFFLSFLMGKHSKQRKLSSLKM